MKTTLILLALGLFLTSCTENQRARQFGGTINVALPKNTKFVHATWKNDELWYAYRPMKEGETAETVTLQEESSFGLIEGRVDFMESK